VTDLERIRRDLVACRDIPWCCSCVEPELLAELVEEVERLRGERDAAAHETSTLRDENGMLREQIADLRMQRDEHLIDNEHAYDEGGHAERAAVVAWLRAECGSPGHEDRYCAYCSVRRNIADDIESGEHRRAREPVEDDSIEYRDIAKED